MSNNCIAGVKLNKRSIEKIFNSGRLINVVCQCWDIDHGEAYYGYAPEDVISDVHLNIIDNKYRANQGGILTYQYIKNAVINRAINYKRKVLADFRATNLNTSEIDEPKHTRSPPNEVEEIVHGTKLNDAISILLADNAELLNIFLLLTWDFTQEEIAVINGLSRNQVRKRIYEIRDIVDVLF